jgi:hypothetical protein
MDTREAREIRLKIWTFLAKHLDPPVQFKTVDEINKVSYERPGE